MVVVDEEAKVEVEVEDESAPMVLGNMAEEVVGMLSMEEGS